VAPAVAKRSIAPRSPGARSAARHWWFAARNVPGLKVARFATPYVPNTRLSGHQRRWIDDANRRRQAELHDHVHRYGQCERLFIRDLRWHRHSASAPSATAVSTAAQRVGSAADSVPVLDRSRFNERDHALSDADEEFGRSLLAVHDGGFALAVVELQFGRQVMERDHAFGSCPPLSGPGDECEWGRCVVQCC